MDVKEALTIVRPLAEGLHPQTGKAYPDDSPIQQASVVRALQVAVTALEAEQERVERRSRMPSNTGVPWDQGEDARLGKAFDEGRNIEQLAKAHGRTVGAMRARLVKLGRMDPAAR